MLRELYSNGESIAIFAGDKTQALANSNLNVSGSKVSIYSQEDDDTDNQTLDIDPYRATIARKSGETYSKKDIVTSVEGNNADASGNVQLNGVTANIETGNGTLVFTRGLLTDFIPA